MMEKHSLNKLKEAWKDDISTLPVIDLVGTFKDEMNLFFDQLMEDRLTFQKKVIQSKDAA